VYSRVLSSGRAEAEDFTVAFQGLVNDFCAAHLVFAAVNLHDGGGATGFPDDPALENESAPFPSRPTTRGRSRP
jgi:hypothetical protein